MIHFRCILLTFIAVIYVTNGYGDLPAEIPAPLAPIPSECRDLMDLYFVLDGSDSISFPDFQHLKDAMASLVPHIRLGERQARIGMLVYSSGVPTDSEHPFSSDFNYLMNAATTLIHPRDGTDTARGIRHMRQMFQRFGRPNLPWVAVIITDGISKNFHATAREAQLAREMGISLFAVGVTHKINETELLAIADTPKQVLFLDAFQELQMRLFQMMKHICPCPAPPVLPLAECGNGPRAIGSVRTYTCKAGYHLRGNPDIFCREDSTWSPLDPNFECAPCGPTPSVMHAHCDGTDNLIGAKRKYGCDLGYALIGNPQIECLPDATWSAPAFSCSPCGKTPDVPMAVCGGGGDLIGNRRHYTCDKRYALIGDPSIECLPNGKWSLPQFSCSLCGEPPLIQHGKCGFGEYFVDSMRQYECEPGYALIGDPQIRCLPNGQWSDLKVSCSLCGEPPMILHGKFGGGEYFVDSIRNYQCDIGYALIGDPSIRCLPNGEWSDVHVSCSLCGEPPIIQHGKCSLGEYFVDSMRQYECEQGYARIGDPQIRCLPNGQWSDVKVSCSLCGEPPLIQHGKCGGGDYFVDSIRNYQCDIGYALIGDPSIRCLPNGEWSDVHVSCSLCGEPPIIQHGKCSLGEYFVDSMRQYECEPGYAQIGDPHIRCLPNGQWSDVKVSCSLCGEPPMILHGKCGGGEYFVDSIRNYQCDIGYALIGDPSIRCLPNGEWSDVHVSCSLCGEPPMILHGKCGGGEYFVDSIRNYQCDIGYALIGDPSIRCLPNGEWSDVHVSCSLCGEPPIIQHGKCSLGEYFVDSMRQYECEQGYARIGDPQIRCLPNGQWSDVKVSCSLCGEPPLIQHGKCGGGDYFVDSIRNYQCDIGYALIGDPSIRCLPNGEWSDVHVSCSLCGEPPIIQHGKCSLGEYFVDSMRQYECEPGYAQIGDPHIRCLPNGQWSDVKVSCSLCGEPPMILHGKCGGGEYFVDSIRNYQCDIGYALIGDPSIRCLPNGEWSDVHVSCSLCGEPPMILHGKCGGGEYFVDSIRNYQCDIGYALIGDPSIRCLPNGEWSDVHVSCSLCGEPPIIQHGKCGLGEYFVDSMRQYECEQGYAQIGDPQIRCLPNGQWSDVKVSCSLCGATPVVQQANCGNGDNFVNSIRKYQCTNGYALIGDPLIRCLPNGLWSDPLFTCSLCGDTPLIDHGICGGGDHYVDSVRKYECELGYAAVGDPLIRCLPNGEWSIPQMACHRSCGDVPVIDHGTCTGEDHIVDSVRYYVCETGYAMIGDPQIRCLPNGRWSDVSVTCRLCGETPRIPHAVCSAGGHFVGDVRRFECKQGYEAVGLQYDIECLPDGMWSRIDLQCKVLECGALPQVPYAYGKLGPNAVGSKREYYCDIGYKLRGRGYVTCLPDGQWEKPRFSCEYIPTTPPPTTPKPVPSNPTVCDGCRFVNGVGYNRHPTDCNQFVQCFIGRTGMEQIYQKCPYGLFWDQNVLTCRESHLVDCPTDRCRAKDTPIYGYKTESDPSNCCSYYKCDNGVSRADCCGKGRSYNPKTGQCEHDNSCQSPCLYQETMPGCDKRPIVYDETKFEQHVGQGRWLVMPCAPGTAFNPVDCQCSLTLVKVPGKVRQVCKPALYLPFHNDHRDRSGQSVYVESHNVSIINGAAYFDGNSRLLIPRFTNQEFGGHLVIKFKYQEVLDAYSYDQIQALVSNGDCGSDPSIIISKIPEYVIMAAKTRKLRTLAVATMNKLWKEVVYMHDESYLEGRVCGASSYTSSAGPIQATHCALQVGYSQGLHKFRGYIDDFTIYQCRPPRLSQLY